MDAQHFVQNAQDYSRMSQVVKHQLELKLNTKVCRLS